MTTEKTNPILLDLPMPVETPRLLLRPLQPGDGDALLEAKRESWDQLTQWMLWAREPYGDGKDEIYVREAAAKFLLRQDLPLVGIEKATGKAVIWTGLHRIDWETRRFEIGYWVRKSAQGQGYAGESTNALLRYAFNVLAARRVEITHAAGNAPSRRTIEKLGFRLEGVKEKEHLLPGGAYVDRLIYARMNLDGLPRLDVKWGPP